MLEKHMPANRVDESAEAVGLAQTALLAEHCQDSCKSLLTHVLNGLRRLQPRAKLQADQQGEIAYEMLLRSLVPCAQTLDVTCIE